MIISQSKVLMRTLTKLWSLQNLENPGKKNYIVEDDMFTDRGIIKSWNRRWEPSNC